MSQKLVLWVISWLDGNSETHLIIIYIYINIIEELMKNNSKELIKQWQVSQSSI